MKRKIKVIDLVLIAALVVSGLWTYALRTNAQTAPTQAITSATSSFAAVGVGGTINLTGTGVQYHQVYAYMPATVTACTYELEGSFVSTFATTSQIGSTITCNTQGAESAFYSAAQSRLPFVRSHLLTYTGTGSVALVYRGYMQDPNTDQRANSSVVVNDTTVGLTQIVAAGTGAVIVNGFGVTLGGVAGTGGAFDFVSGTGSNCTTSTTALSGIFAFAASSGTYISMGNGETTLFRTSAGQALCIRNYSANATNAIGGVVSFKQEN